MILLKFFSWVFVIYLGLFFLVRFILPLVTRFLFRYVMKKAQQDMDRQSRVYEQYADGHSPFEDNVYVDKNTRVSIKREDKEQESKRKTTIDSDLIEDVTFEDID